MARISIILWDLLGTGDWELGGNGAWKNDLRPNRYTQFHLGHPNHTGCQPQLPVAHLDLALAMRPLIIIIA